MDDKGDGVEGKKAAVPCKDAGVLPPSDLNRAIASDEGDKTADPRTDLVCAGPGTLFVVDKRTADGLGGAVVVMDVGGVRKWDDAGRASDDRRE